MSNPENPIAEAMNADQAGKTVAELASMGCKFVVEGDVFEAVVLLLDKLLIDGAADSTGEAFLFGLRTSLLQTSKPVRAKLGFRDDNDSRVKVARTLPNFPASIPKLVK